jgi:hypothetical protein
VAQVVEHLPSKHESLNSNPTKIIYLSTPIPPKKEETVPHTQVKLFEGKKSWMW